MVQHASDTFSPPSAEQFADYLESHPPRGPSKAAAWIPLAILAAAALLTVATQSSGMLLLAWVALGGVFVFWAIRVKRMRLLDELVLDVQELGLRRRYPQSLRLAWRLLPQLAVVPQLHGRNVAFMAFNLDQLRAFDAAIVGYSYLIDRMPGEHPSRVHLQVQRAIAQLAADQLTDADNALRKLRGIVSEMVGTATHAMFQFAVLFQQVRTYHYQDALPMADSLVEDLRPLGVDAGYGHALMALCWHQSHQGKTAEDADADAQQAADAARTWWHRATLLLPVTALTARLDDLKPMLDDDALVAAAASCSPPVGDAEGRA